MQSEPLDSCLLILLRVAYRGSAYEEATENTYRSGNVSFQLTTVVTKTLPSRITVLMCQQL